jgi:hypothetical protein
VSGDNKADVGGDSPREGDGKISERGVAGVKSTGIGDLGAVIFKESTSGSARDTCNCFRLLRSNFKASSWTKQCPMARVVAKLCVSTVPCLGLKPIEA